MTKGDAALNLQQSFQVLERRERSAGAAAAEPSHYARHMAVSLTDDFPPAGEGGVFEEQVARAGGGVGGGEVQRQIKAHVHAHTHTR